MKTWQLSCLLSALSVRLWAQDLIIFDKQQIISLTPEHIYETTSEVNSILLGRFRQFLESDNSSGNKIDLTTPPLEWGKKVNDETHGVLFYQELFTFGFVTQMSLTNLEPNHAYRLTLNGNPEWDGNMLLPDPVPGFEEERYYDFLDITTDDKGSYSTNLAVRLIPGKYFVRFYVKDMNDWKIVLYHDYFRFMVEGDSQ